MTLGKKLGLYAFIICELLVFLFLGLVLLEYKTGHFMHYDFLGRLLFFQGTIFTVTWGAKASSNFCGKNSINDKGPGGM